MADQEANLATGQKQRLGCSLEGEKILGGTQPRVGFLVQFGVNTMAEIKPGSLRWVLQGDFCRG